MSLLGTLDKEPQEKFPIAIDFLAKLVDGEEIITAEATVRNYDTGELDATLLSGLPGIDGSRVVQTIQAGATGGTFVLQVKITTDSGNVFEDEVKITVQDF